jgi:hypothetical protein
MLQLVSKACAVFVLLITLSLASVGQSTDRDNPTKLTSPEIAGFVDAQNAKIQYYYSFTAGPGEVVITLDVKAVGKGNSVSFEYEIFDQDAKKIVGDYGSSYDGKEDRRVQRFVL